MISETLYAAAEYMRGHGFSVHIIDGECRCFIGAILSIARDGEMAAAIDYIGGRIFDHNNSWYATEKLANDRWTTRDAVAALTIAADCAASEGK